MHADTARHVRDRAPVIDHELYRRGFCTPVNALRVDPIVGSSSSGTRGICPTLHQSGNGPGLYHAPACLPLEGGGVVVFLADVETDEDVEPVLVHDSPPLRTASWSPSQAKIVGTHVTKRPHRGTVGRVPISDQPTPPGPGDNTPDHQRQGRQVMPGLVTRTPTIGAT